MGLIKDLCRSFGAKPRKANGESVTISVWTPGDSREHWLQLGPRACRGTPFWALYLDPDLGEVDLARQLLAAVHVGVMGFLKGAFQLVQLVCGEGRAVPPVFLLGLLLLRLFCVAGGGPDRQPRARPCLPGLLGAIGARGWDEEAPEGQRHSLEYPWVHSACPRARAAACGLRRGRGEGCPGPLSFL